MGCYGSDGFYRRFQHWLKNICSAVLVLKPHLGLSELCSMRGSKWENDGEMKCPAISLLCWRIKT